MMRIVLALFLSLLPAPARGHGDSHSLMPPHGGTLGLSGDHHLELVAGKQGADVYLYDARLVPIALAGRTVRLAVLDGTGKLRVETLAARGERARTARALAAGTRVLVVVEGKSEVVAALFEVGRADPVAAATTNSGVEHGDIDALVTDTTCLLRHREIGALGGCRPGARDPLGPVLVEQKSAMPFLVRYASAKTPRIDVVRAASVRATGRLVPGDRLRIVVVEAVQPLSAREDTKARGASGARR